MVIVFIIVSEIFSTAFQNIISYVLTIQF